eukprot:7787890-Karenia_brevis.AAC.1
MAPKQSKILAAAQKIKKDLVTIKKPAAAIKKPAAALSTVADGAFLLHSLIQPPSPVADDEHDADDDDEDGP